MTGPIVLVHGGGFAASCWDRLRPLLSTPSIAVDLPGRGRRPMRLTEVTIDRFVDAVVTDIVAAGLDEVTLVGHSLAGVTLPGVAAAVPDRLARLVFVACTVPRDGSRVVDTLADPDVRAMAEHAARQPPADEPLDTAVATALFCNDMDADTTAYTLSIMVPEAVAVTAEPVSLAGLDQPIERRWIRTLDDAVVPADLQAVFAERVGAGVSDLAAGHMAMISSPQSLADVLVRDD